MSGSKKSSKKKSVVKKKEKRILESKVEFLNSVYVVLDLFFMHVYSHNIAKENKTLNKIMSKIEKNLTKLQDKAGKLMDKK